MSGQNSKSINEVFKNVVEKSSSHSALIYLGEKYSYAKIDAMVEQIAGSLFELGVKQNDKVIIYAPHCPQWIIAWFAILRLGAIAIPVTHFYGPKDLKYIANDSGAETVFCMDTNYGYIDKIAADTKIKRTIVAYDLTKWCKERLNSYEVPQYIEFRDMLPKSKVGKILRRELRDEERRKMEIS